MAFYWCVTFFQSKKGEGIVREREREQQEVESPRVMNYTSIRLFLLLQPLMIICVREAHNELKCQ